MATRKGGAKFTDLEREMVKERVAALHLKGYTQTAIAKEVGVAQSMVCVYISQLKEEYRSRAVHHKGEQIQEKLEQFALLRAEAYQAWERSQQCSNPAIRLNGDAEFLKVVLAVHQKECALLGLDEQPEGTKVGVQVNNLQPGQSVPTIREILDAAKEQMKMGTEPKPRVIEAKLNGTHQNGAQERE